MTKFARLHENTKVALHNITINSGGLFRGQDIFAGKYVYEKLTKFPNHIFAQKYIFLNFGGVTAPCLYTYTYGGFHCLVASYSGILAIRLKLAAA